MNETLLFAIAYFYGRARGNDEEMKQEIEARFGENAYTMQVKYAYEQGISDYCEFDEHADSA
jgi:hypothetical protein